MAVNGNMKVTNATIAGSEEILNRPPYEGVSMTLDDEAFSENGVVKAGSLITAKGTVSAEEAVGVLLTDVYKERPQGTVLKKAYVNLKRIKESLGEGDYSTQYGTIPTNLPMIVFEEDPKK